FSAIVGRHCSLFFFFSSRRRHTRFSRDWSSDVCSSDLTVALAGYAVAAGWPAGAISVLSGDALVGKALVEHPAVRLVSFTGSTAVGAAIAATAGAQLKRTVLELGSNAATIVAADADLDLAARRCAHGAMASSGQSCISVQRVFAERSIAA